MPSLICPLCRNALHLQEKTWRCEQGHGFDVSREGYINLLAVQHKKSREPGDNPDMVKARRAFLQAGHYQALRDAAVDLLRPLQAQSLLDVGCGEGHYTSALTRIAPDVVGMDISKLAIQLAAKRYPGITWLVATSASLPLADASADVVSSLFSPLPVAEMARVLKPGGTVLVATPAPEHLWSMRKELFDEVRAHQPDKFLKDFAASFELHGRQELSFPLMLSQQALKDLLLMTPYAWRATAEKRAALALHQQFHADAAFTLLLFRKKP